MQKYHTLLLDADGTLFDFSLAEEQAFFLTCTAHGIPVGEGEFATYRAINEAYWGALERKEVTKPELVVRRFADFFAQIGATADPAEFNDAYLKNLALGSFLMPGAEACVRALHGRCRLIIASNGVALTQRRRVADSAIAELIEHVIVSEEAGCEKPDPAYFDYAFKKCGITDLAGVLMVGDSLSADIAGGIAAGIDTCWFNPAGAPLRQGLQPTHEITSLSELVGIALGEVDPKISTADERDRAMQTTQQIHEFMQEHDTNCAETLFIFANRAYGLGLPDEAMRLVAGFGGGMGCKRLCGALAGTIAVIGQVTLTGVEHQNPVCREGCKSMVERFIQVFGSTECEAIRATHRDAVTGCAGVVATTLHELDKLLLGLKQA